MVVHDFHAFVFQSGRPLPPEKLLHGHFFDGRALVTKGHTVVEGQRLAQPQLTGEISEVNTNLPLEYEERASAEIPRRIGHLLVQARENGGHHNHGGGANQHPQDGQERAEFMGPERVQSQQQVFADVLPWDDHAQASVLNASMGSSLAARLAG